MDTSCPFVQRKRTGRLQTETACPEDLSIFDIRDDAAEARAGEEVPSPLDGDREVGMGAGEAQEMDEHPCAPCEEARHLRVHLRLVDTASPRPIVAIAPRSL